MTTSRKVPDVYIGTGALVIAILIVLLIWLL